MRWWKLCTHSTFRHMWRMHLFDSASGHRDGRFSLASYDYDGQHHCIHVANALVWLYIESQSNTASKQAHSCKMSATRMLSIITVHASHMHSFDSTTASHRDGRLLLVSYDGQHYCICVGKVLVWLYIESPWRRSVTCELRVWRTTLLYACLECTRLNLHRVTVTADAHLRAMIVMDSIVVALIALRHWCMRASIFVFVHPAERGRTERGEFGVAFGFRVCRGVDEKQWPLSLPHACTHTNADTHAYTRTHIHTHTRTDNGTDTDTDIDIDTDTNTDTPSLSPGW